MNKLEVNEIKKQFKKLSECNILKLSTCFVGEDKSCRIQPVQRFLNMPDEETYKYLDLFKKALSGDINRTLFNMEFPTVEEEEHQLFFETLRQSALEDDEILEQYFTMIANSYVFGGNYMIIVINANYDVPYMGTDMNILEDSSTDVYSYIFTLICPVNLSKSGLSYDVRGDKVETMDQFLGIDPPADAILYPAFNDRQTDVNAVLYYAKNAKNTQEMMLDNLIGKPDRPNTQAEERAWLSDTLTDVLDRPLTFDNVCELQRRITEEVLAHPDENLSMNKRELTGLLTDCGMDEDYVATIEKAFDDSIGEGQDIALKSIGETKGLTIKTGDVAVKTSNERMDLIEVMEVDGRMCLIIPLDENDFEVNGLPARAYAQRHELD